MIKASARIMLALPFVLYCGAESHAPNGAIAQLRTLEDMLIEHEHITALEYNLDTAKAVHTYPCNTSWNTRSFVFEHFPHLTTLFTENGEIKVATFSSRGKRTPDDPMKRLHDYWDFECTKEQVGTSQFFACPGYQVRAYSAFLNMPGRIGRGAVPSLPPKHASCLGDGCYGSIILMGSAADIDKVFSFTGSGACNLH